YFALVDPLDKAGAYAVQEHGELLIDRVEGSYSTVIGLPLESLVSILERHPGSGLPADGLKRLVAELGNPFG
ncbi:MAG TPA: Maf family protein, partial [bacterium]|nr:Maf family protein [bacterium]